MFSMATYNHSYSTYEAEYILEMNIEQITRSLDMSDQQKYSSFYASAAVNSESVSKRTIFTQLIEHVIK